MDKSSKIKVIVAIAVLAIAAALIVYNMTSGGGPPTLPGAAAPRPTNIR